MPNATLRSRLLSSQTSGNKAVGYFLARDIELSCSRAGRKSLSRKGLPAKPGFCFSPSSDRMSCGNVVGNVRETKPRSGSDYVGIAELASMQAYWGVFCAFADPLGEVMGAYLSAPVTEKESHEGENSSFKYAISAMQGWRTSMEDAHAAVLNIDQAAGQLPMTGYFAIFDGHGGKEVAKFAAKYLADELVKSPGWQQGNVEAALAETYLKIDEILSKEATREELLEMAGDGGEQSRPSMVVDEYELPENMRNVLLARIKAHNERRTLGADEDEDWGGDEFEDPDFDPLVELDQGEVGNAGDTDVMTRDDSDNENDDSAEATSDSGQEEESPASDGSGEGQVPNGTISASPPDEYRGPAAGCTAEIETESSEAKRIIRKLAKVVALVRDKTLWVANAGDSRCVCSRNGVAVAMTNDHKPTDAEEHARITRAGGFISDGRVNGSLNLSRALGDLEYKRVKGLPPAQQMITAMPEIRSLELHSGDEFLVLACDGIWDVLSNQQAVSFVRERLQRGMEPRAICEAMCDACLAPDTDGCGKGCDNMSAMVVVLKPFASKDVSEGAIPIPPQPPSA